MGHCAMAAARPHAEGFAVNLGHGVGPCFTCCAGAAHAARTTDAACAARAAGTARAAGAAHTAGAA